MAKPKVKIIVEVILDAVYPIKIFCDDPAKVSKEISEIEGVLQILLIDSKGPIRCAVEPRYDINEVAEEIKTLLLAEVPDVFKE